jgi:hypothetical protein
MANWKFSMHFTIDVKGPIKRLINFYFFSFLNLFLWEKNHSKKSTSFFYFWECTLFFKISDGPIKIVVFFSFVFLDMV